MALHVRSYLLLGRQQPEIRLFSVPEDASSSFAYLTEKIRRIYPDLLRKDFKLFWQDESKEYITFSSDEELVEALANIKSDVFKIFIKVTSSAVDEQKEQKENTNDVEHPGVICDGCNSGIKGTRYKCVVCFDFDLCNACDSKGHHSQHDMIRIRHPRNVPRPDFRSSGCRGPRRACFVPRGFGGSPNLPFHGPFGFRAVFKEREDNKKDNSNEEKEKEAGKQSPEDEEIDIAECIKVFGDVVGAALHPFFNPESWEGDKKDQEEKTTKEEPAEKSTSEPNKTESKQESKKLDSQSVLKDDTVGDKVVKQASKEGDADFVLVEDVPEDELEIDTPQNTQTQEEEYKNETQKPQTEDQIYQKKLDDALALMETMGFKNEDGWLTQLLISKDFDVGRVINVILPQGRLQ